MKSLLLALTLIAGTATAAPWNRDCVTFWGGKIPPAERTQENCPSGHSHWDAPVQGSGSVQTTGNSSNGLSQPVLNPSLPTTVLTGSGTYVIVPNYSGGSLPRAIIPVSRK